MDQPPFDLFSVLPDSGPIKVADAPLAYRLRPTNLADFAGFLELQKRYPFLGQHFILPSIVFYGPPGSGKTTLAHLLANAKKLRFFDFNAVNSGVADLKKLMAEIWTAKLAKQYSALLFIDEIHRFSSAQQDVLLPMVEKGAFVLVGATTENPFHAINRALLSRMQVVELPALQKLQLKTILIRALDFLTPAHSISEAELDLIQDFSNGDARRALTLLELIHQMPLPRNISSTQNLVQHFSRSFDHHGDRHYDVISALIKSMRASDPQGACLWLAVALDGGEDPVFIARRLVIFASEDVGNADPLALLLATAALTAVQNIGMPEARINLAHVAIYLAGALKSRKSYEAIELAMSYVKERPTLEVPQRLTNKVKKTVSKIQESPVPIFYHPSDVGREKILKDNLKSLSIMD